MTLKTSSFDFTSPSFDLTAGDLLSGNLLTTTPAPVKKAAAVAKNTLPVFVEPKPQPVVVPPPATTLAVTTISNPSGGGYFVGDLLHSGRDLLNPQPSQSLALVGTQSVTQQVIATQMKKGGALSLTTNVDLQKISNRIQEKALADIDKTHASIMVKIEEYGKRTGEVNAEMSDYAMVQYQKARDGTLVVNDAKTAEIQQLVLLTKATIDLHFQSAKQFIELHALKRVEMMNHYTGLVAFVYDEKKKEMELVDMMIKTTKDSEKHQLEIFLGYHGAWLKEEKQRTSDLIEYVKLAAEVQEKEAEGKRADAQQKFDQLLQMENALIERYKVEGERQVALIEIQNKQELALKDADQKALSDQFTKDLKLRELELSAELGAQEMNNNFRVQLLDVAIKDAIDKRQKNLDLRKAESEEALGLKKLEVEDKLGGLKIVSDEKVGMQQSADAAAVKKEEAKQATKQVQSQESTKKIVGTANAITGIVKKPLKVCAIQ